MGMFLLIKHNPKICTMKRRMNREVHPESFREYLRVPIAIGIGVKFPFTYSTPVSGCGSGKKEGKENFLSGWKEASSFASFGLCVGLCDLQMCLSLHLQQFYFFLVTCK
jgi:hypothetical protein